MQFNGITGEYILVLYVFNKNNCMSQINSQRSYTDDSMKDTGNAKKQPREKKEIPQILKKRDNFAMLVTNYL